MPRVGIAVQRPSTLNAAVMRPSARVVALPDPKNSGFPAESTSFRTAGLQDTCRGIEMTSDGVISDLREEVNSLNYFNLSSTVSIKPGTVV